MRKLLLPLAIVAGILVGGAYVFRAPLSVLVAERIAPGRIAADVMPGLPDGLHVALCGAGSPFPDPQRAGPCTVVVAGKRLFVFDAGSGSARNIGRLGFVLGHVEAVFLTHFHSDHIDGLGELMLQRWVTTSNTAPVPVYGPTGVDQVVAGLRQAYAQDQHYRVAHHGDATVPASGFGGTARPFALALQIPTVVLKEGDLEITAFSVDHAPIHPSVGYRIRYKGRSVVLRGDTRKSAVVQREAVGADLLVHEALSEELVAVLERSAGAVGRPRLKKIFNDIQNYHTTPEQAAEVARDAGVRFLLLNHIVPALALPGMEAAFLGKASDIFDGPIRVGTDGDFISLPAGSTEILFDNRF